MQWKGYLPYEASWEPEEGILPRCEELFNWRCNNSRKCVFFQGGRRTALEIAVTFACKVVFSGMFFVSCLLVRECRRRDGHFLKKMISMVFIFLLGEIPGWILMAREWRFFTLWRLKRISWSQRSMKWVWWDFYSVTNSISGEHFF